jgi:hypothetical protein
LKLELTINPGERHTLELSPQANGSFILAVEVIPKPSGPVVVKVIETEGHIQFPPASLLAFEEAAKSRE